MSSSIATVITCIGNSARDSVLLRVGLNRSKKMNLPWIALHIETPSPAYQSEEEKEQLARNIRGAQAAGARMVWRKAASVEEGIDAFLKEEKENGPFHFMFGQSVKRWKLPWRRKHASYHLSRSLTAPNHIEVIALTDVSLTPEHTFFAPLFKGSGIRGLLEAVSFVSIATLISELFRLFLPSFTFNIYTHNIALIYLIASVICATRCGIVPALIASVISFVTLDFFYTAPYYSLFIAQTADIVNLLLFLGASVFISLFGSGTHAYIMQAKERERYMQALVNISGTLNRSFSRSEALQYLHREMKTLLRLDVAYFLPSALSDQAVGVIYPAETVLDNESQAAFDLCWNDNLPTGYGTAHFTRASWRFEVMMSADGFVGILGARVPDDSTISLSMGLMLTVLSDLSASILARIEQTQMMEESRVAEEREKLRTMLLSSVSHDLKTPLASIIGSLDIFHRLHASLAPERRDALTHTAYDEAIRLDSFITNIIDMAKLETGKILVNKEYADPVLLVRRIIRRMEAKLAEHRIRLDLPAEPFEVEFDSTLMEKVIFHLIDNAVKYTAPGTLIVISITREGDLLNLSISDSGTGIPVGMEESIFSKYTRLHKKDMAVAGTGLGLAISRAIINAHGGSIEVYNNAGQGATFTVQVPNTQTSTAAIETTEVA